MVPLAPADIRNFAVAGHASSGKTILTEAMLLCSGAIGRMGRISEGSTVSDYHVSERQRQISTQTSLLHTNWLGKRFNILDSPGYPDFMNETLGLRARGGARTARGRRRDRTGLELRNRVQHSQGPRSERH